VAIVTETEKDKVKPPSGKGKSTFEIVGIFPGGDLRRSFSANPVYASRRQGNPANEFITQHAVVALRIIRGDHPFVTETEMYPAPVGRFPRRHYSEPSVQGARCLPPRQRQRTDTAVTDRPADDSKYFAFRCRFQIAR
jgi:hypothetical protein